ncbi:MAG: hypothetical protein D3M94_21525 [Rhodocyclales bacterium GT-UBC]|nr:MAG: hypothetical protein D3M94_21525 [Rhodocyclales bacterium GT-UBC]
MYLWLGQKDYHAALSAMKNSFSLGDQDPVNRLNAIQLMRALGDKAGVLNMLNDIEGRKLTELDRANLNELKSELLAEGVLEGVSQ